MACTHGDLTARHGPAVPGSHRRSTPAIGQDSDATLREIGLSDDPIAALRARGIVA